MLKIGFVSLGCAKNLVDTEVMLGILLENSFAITADPWEADIIIINTCSFIDSAKEESISTVLQMAEYKQNGKCRGIIVAGCLGQRYQQELLDELPEVSAIVGTGAWPRIMEAIQATLAGQRVVLTSKLDVIYDENMPRINTMPPYSAYVKIAEGCSNCCSYCVIPAIRGNFRSRHMESIVKEVKDLVRRGVKEINLIAQDTTSYGRDLYGQPCLTKLLQELVQIEDITWIRLLYCYPKYFTDKLIEMIAAEPKICKYVDLPLQHCHDDILLAMNRRDRKSDIETLLMKLRMNIPGVVLRTSFIVGFPGETEEHFAALKQFVMKHKFERMGIFTYSQEEGTPAASMIQQVSDEVKEERYHQLMALQCQISEELNQQMEGRKLDILIEGRSSEQPEVGFGRSYREAPDVDGKVYVEGATEAQPGDIITVEIVQGFTYDLLGEKLPS
ncbi:MAG TPA: 30S ribosomal protein S12 methylthiotransferase RimO [Methylomusa anaerophila]|uniref:Ribosomal protein uS12 methylthiotransferase RimO n=1 Tax=Methylomusa anaerophila TaxID=1930071 RepID=A0A348APW3_9FIRM|nr:30S ribosomal protein S12 methylthiotransferase RimO [Methylomusa anaerophila]BBB93111.1 ribosomal protein S12 methylthiotransferase RimO [Methylomusa anaerophila]HML87056.1 30S ribosomal protein S12 methylthiotransferase RimO [Methylomusa anaerophila]